jgi:hypothetical protein
MFFRIIYPRISHGLSKNQINAFNKLANTSNNILNVSKIQKISLPASYLIFSLKEIYDYINERTEDEDEESIYELKKLYFELKSLKNQEKKVSELLY